MSDYSIVGNWNVIVDGIVFINGKSSRVNTTAFLIATLHDQLKWEEHISSVMIKMSKSAAITFGTSIVLNKHVS